MKKLFFLNILLLLSLAAATGCGNDDGPVAFTISPSTATVQRSTTLQFATNPADLDDVEWTVVGGDSNGTIDNDGLYTAPDSIPIDNVITISAERDGVSDSATVTIVAANTLAFSSPEQINQTPTSNASAILAVIYQGTGNGIGAGLGSVDVSSAWLAVPGSDPDVMYSQSTDLAPFLPEVNLTNSSDAVFNSLFLDQNLNPGIFYTTVSTDTLYFLGSQNQGASFSTPVPVVSAPSGLFEAIANASVDGDNNYYLTYTEDLTGTPVVKFSVSTDQGATWSVPTLASPTANPFLASNIAVSEDGDTIAICYTENVAGNFEVFVSVSTDGGASFALQTNISGSPNSESFCDVALGPQGQIYATFDQDPGGGDRDVLFVASTDGGVSFTSPLTVNSSTDGDQSLPFLSVDNLGRIDVAWGDDNSAGGTTLQVGYARSIDGGSTFTNSQLVPASDASFVVPRGLVHDESGRMHFQYFSDVNDPGNNVDFFYIFGQ